MIQEPISHYRILHKLGAGGMGEVYLAEDMKLRRKVALKLLAADLVQNEDRRRRFEQEAQAASALSHPNILVIYEIGMDGGHHFIATEYIEGETLRAAMAGMKMDFREALDIAIQVASALDAAHTAGIIHRDIKPENLMWRPGGYVKVLDFGLAKLNEPQAVSSDTAAPTIAKVDTDPGTVMGTINYMSPEQARAKTVDARSDLFSLGVVLYEMIAGVAPFEGETTTDVLAAIINRQPPPLARFAREVPEALEWIVAKALTKDRDGRYQTAKELLTDLRRLKQQLEFEDGLERSMSGDGMIITSGGRTGVAPTRVMLSRTSAAAPARTTSSAEYIINGIARHKKVTAGIAAALVIAAAATFFFLRRAPALTEKDTILIADFVNTTGDAVFDGTLKQALAVQLEQSPFLNIFSDQQVREALRFMGRSPDDRVTKDVAREICERQGLKAMLAGSIASLGSHYVVTLEALNAQTGAAIAREQSEADAKEQVLVSLGKAATKLREKLGESLGSIQKFDTPIEQATTSSLEALKAFSLAREQNVRGKFFDALASFKRATELDPNFASAYSALAANYSNTGQRELAQQAAQKAFELRDRASERERLSITSSYYTFVTGEIDKNIETLEQLKQIYPRFYVTHNNLGLRYAEIGRYEKAIEEYREAIRINPNLAISYGNMASAFVRLNRFDEAKEMLEHALALNPDASAFRRLLYLVAFIQGDHAAMQQQVDWGNAKPDEYAHLVWQAGTAAFQGQLRQAEDINRRAVQVVLRRNLKEGAANLSTGEVLWSALSGNCQQVKQQVSDGLAIMRSGDSLWNAAIASAFCGDLSQAQALADEYTKRFPKDTLINAIWLPMIRAVIELRRGNPAQAVQLLESATAYGGVGGFGPEYIRGQAYLSQRAGAEAAAEFQKILDHRGWSANSFLYPLAHLGLARAAALTGDTAKARTAYQDFFGLWKDADADLPILQQARQEYQALR
jgi:eukaryotic-like serine/threonine-protein kinase